MTNDACRFFTSSRLSGPPASIPVILWALAAAILTQGLGAVQPSSTPPTEATYIVLLEQPSVVERVLEATREQPVLARRALLRGPFRQHLQEEVESAQEAFLRQQWPALLEDSSGGGGSELAQPSIKKRRAFLLNLLVIQATEEVAAELADLAGVRSVFRDALRVPLMDAAPAVVQADVLWELMGGSGEAGRGVRIAIIDSGINVDHPMFADAGFAMPAGFPLPDQDLDFVNNKVIVARSYHELFPANQSNQTPEDETGHGSRVAGVAAGGSVQAPLAAVSGIAPAAYLGSYKVFGTPGINSSASIASIIVAINDAVADGMDVINLSLGGDPREPGTDPEQQAIRLATEMGVVVVASAGNEGPQTGTITSPATSPDAIAVGAVSNGRTFSPALRVFAIPDPPAGLRALAYQAGAGVEITQEVGTLELVSVQMLDPTEEACSPLPPASLFNQIVLVRRGSCLFQTKADNVFAAGAEALVVYNNLSGAGPIIMAFEGGAGGPAVMISNPDGEALRDFLLVSPNVTAALGVESDLFGFPAKAGVLTGFSSRGPTLDLSIKPDLAAVGAAIYSAGRTADQFVLGSSGTSFAAPIVAGAAALIKQIHPDWPATQIKSALVNSATQQVEWNGEPARVIQTGSGLLDVVGAASITATLEPVSLSFGIFHSEDESTQLSRFLTITNQSAQTRHFDLQLELTSENPTLQLWLPETSLVVAPEQSVAVEVLLTISDQLAAGAFEGYLRFDDQGEGSDLVAALWGGAVIKEELTLQLAADGSTGLASLGSALELARAGNTIEFVDSATYREASQIRFNREGLPLDGIRLMSQVGQSPVLDASGFSQPVLSIEGLNDVRIEGLTLRGGTDGIEFQDSSGAVQGSFVENASGSGISLVNSGVFVLDTQLTGIKKAAVALVGSSQALLTGNQIGTLVNPNESSGVLANASTVLGLFENRFEGNGARLAGGQAIRVSGGQALVKGNLIRESRGPGGDGVQLSGSGSEGFLVDNRISANQWHGVSLLSGAQALLLRNQIDSNQAAGVSAGGNSRLQLASSLLVQNGTGVVLQNANSALITNSILAFSSAATDSFGLFSSDTSTLQVTNSLLWGNSHGGAILHLPGQVTIVNTIFGSNSGLDVSGFAAQHLTSNLISDGTFAGSNGNSAEDPQLNSPAELDFRLTAGSPAVDRGENTLVSGPTDLEHHVRIVDGDQDGLSQIDLGPFEFASQYAPAFILPWFAPGPAEFVGVAFTNSRTAPPAIGAGSAQEGNSTVLLRAFDSDGGLLQSVEVSVAAGTQVSTLLHEEFSGPRQGWVEILPTGPDLVSFSLAGNDDLVFLDGVQLARATARSLVFPELRTVGQNQTTLFLVNPSLEQVSLRLIHQPSGQVQNRILASRGMLRADVGELFGAVTGGWVGVETSLPVALFGMEIFGTPDSKGGLLAQDAQEGGEELFAAHFASGPGIKSVLNVVNLGGGEEVLIEAVSEGGQVMANTRRNVAAGGQLREPIGQLLSLDESLQIGWLRIHSSSAQLIGSLSFEEEGRFLATLPLEQRGAREFLLSHVAHTPQIFTGVTLLNPLKQHTLVSLEVFTQQGVLAGRAFRKIEGGHKIALQLHEWIPGLNNQTDGFIRIRSTHPIFGFELFGGTNLEFMAAVPRQVVVH